MRHEVSGVNDCSHDVAPATALQDFITVRGSGKSRGLQVINFDQVSTLIGNKTCQFLTHFAGLRNRYAGDPVRQAEMH